MPLWHEVQVGLMCVGADQVRDGTGAGRHRYGGLMVHYETERAESEQRVESGTRSQLQIGEFGQALEEPFVGGAAKSVAVDVMPSAAPAAWVTRAACSRDKAPEPLPLCTIARCWYPGSRGHRSRWWPPRTGRTVGIVHEEPGVRRAVERPPRRTM